MIPKKGFNFTLALFGTAAFLFLSWLAVEAHHPASGSRPHEAVRRKVHFTIPDFLLTDQSGRTFQLKSLKGKVVLLSFVYTTCPDVCPLVTNSMSSVQMKLSHQERSSVYLLSITTDPEVDRPAVLKSYTERYKVDLSQWSFLTGSSQQLALVWKAFGLTVVKKARGLVSHTTLTALLDREGVVRFTYDGSAPDAGTILKDLQTLLGAG